MTLNLSAGSQHARKAARAALDASSAPRIVQMIGHVDAWAW
jgi:hypothetical protein